MDKIKSFLLQFWPVLCIAFLWFIFASPYFVSGKVPFPSSHQVDFFPPWSAYNEKYPSVVKNNAMPDVVEQIYPWKHFTITQLKQGNIAFWNPYNFAGNPHLANFQSAVFSPFNLLYLLFPFLDAWSIVVLLQPLLGGIFLYLFMRELAVTKIGAALSAVTFMFCGFVVVWMAYGTLAMAIVFLPFCLFAIERFFRTSNKFFLILLSSGLAVSFFSGHFQTSLYLAMYSFAYLVFSLYSTKDIKRSMWGIAFFGLGMLISLLQILPSIQFYQSSIRSGLAHHGGGIPWQYLITMIAPDFYGNPVTRNDWFGTYAEWSSFIGLIPFLLACFASAFQRNAKVLFFAIAGLVTLLLAMDTPVHEVLIASKIPILSTSIPSRIIVLFSFSFAVLAGFGLDVLQKLMQEKKLRNAWPIMLALASSILLVWLLLFGFNVLPNDKNQTSIAARNFLLPTMLFATITMLLYLRRFLNHGFVPVAVCFLLFFMTAFDSYRFAAKWMPFDSREFVFPDVPVIQAMQKNIGNGRVYGNLGIQVETYYGLPSLEGYDPLYIQRYGEFIQYAATGTFKDAQRSAVRLDRRGKHTDRVLDLLGVTIVFHPIADTNQSWAYPVWEDRKKFTLLYEDDKFQLFRNTTALPRVKLFYNYEVIKDGRAQLKRFYDESFDFRNTLVLETEPSEKITKEVATGSAKIISSSPNSLEVSVSTQTPALLFLSDTYYPKWKARVNGNDVSIERANYAFKAITVPAGESQVEFYYQEYF